jgi:hypothetical protein
MDDQTAHRAWAEMRCNGMDLMEPDGRRRPESRAYIDRAEMQGAHPWGIIWSLGLEAGVMDGMI